MSLSHRLRGERMDELLHQAIDERAIVQLTQRTDDGWRSFHANFISGARREGRLYISAPEAARGAAAASAPIGESVGVAFRLGHKKCLCSTTLHAVTPYNPHAPFYLQWPAEMELLRRRVYERAAPPPGRVIAVRMWVSGTPQAGRGDRSAHYGELEDISAGGMRVSVGDASTIREGVTYSCLITPAAGAQPLVLEALPRHREATNGGRTKLGFQFIGLEATAEGRKTLSRLARLVTEFQRFEAATSV